MKRSKKGFTLIELLVVVAIIALLVSILLPSLGRAREMAKRAMCQTNLHAVGQAIALYMAESKDMYPMLYNVTAGPDIPLADDVDYKTSNVAPFTGGTNWTNGLDPTTGATIYGKAPQQNLILLVSYGTVQERTFCCPSAVDTPTNRDGDTNNDGLKYGFATAKNVSYGIQLPAATVANVTVPNAAYLRDNMDGGMVIMADRPDKTAAGTLAAAGTGAGSKVKNSGNHSGEGQAVLFGAMNVAWETTVTCGAAGNNIYAQDITVNATTGQTTIGGHATKAVGTGGIVDPRDSVITAGIPQ